MQFGNTLIKWYLGNKRDLPWRSSQDPYYIWLSEIILQQTRVDQGIPYYFKFIEAFPTVADLARASEEEVLKLWQGLGYYSRARNLHTAAKMVVNRFNGRFPATYDSLLQLKGVGDYTASAVASIAYGEPVAVVDGNVFRVLSRVYGIDTPINSTEGRKQFKKLAQELLPKDQPSDFNQGLMEFGAIQCTPRRPGCGICPFRDRCVAYNQNKIESLPVKLKKQKVRQRFFNYLVFEPVGNKTLLERRQGKGIWEGLYEFPLVETSQEMAVENLMAEEGFLSYISPEEARVTLYNEEPIVHKLSHQHINTRFWVVSCDRLPAEGVAVSDLEKFPVPVLIDKFIDTFDF